MEKLNYRGFGSFGSFGKFRNFGVSAFRHYIRGFDFRQQTKQVSASNLKCNIVVHYTEEFAILHRIIRYSVNEFAYNKGLISSDTYFAISRDDCILNNNKKINIKNNITKKK